MSKSRTRRKPIRVSIPAVNLGVLRGGDMNETRTELERKEDELAEIKIDTEIERQRRYRDQLERGEPVVARSEDKLGERLMDEVVVPMVQKNLEQPAVPRGTQSEAVAKAAIDLARDAMNRKGAGGPQPTTLNDVIDMVFKVKEFVKDDASTKQLEEISEKLKELEKGKGNDELGTIDKVLDLYDRVEKRLRPSGGGSTDKFYDFEKWKTEHDRKTTMQDRAFKLRLRQQDKEHDFRIAELGIMRERTEMFRDGLKTIGSAVVEGLTDENLEEEETPRQKRRTTSGKGRIWRGKCTKCGKPVLVPPEGQVAGKEFSCSCGAVFEWFDE